MARPVIAITGPQRGAFGPRTLVSLAVRLYGGRPLQLRPGDAGRVHRFDGVVITGGHDVNPVLYAAAPEVEPRYDEARDELEVAIIDEALERRLPLLGICRGAQLLNVRLGGTLFQELKSRRRKTSNRWTVLPLKTLCIRPGTVLARVMGEGTARINSLHNQAIDLCGQGLQVSGTDLDELPQAIEEPDHGPLLLGVQWHPEFLIFMKRQRALFRALVESARETMQQT
ncbi:MAG: gamma-glutamyl-gamma-aminobutyrate hydrolase family protein [Azoarcus sp.]|nr:gamma-glutamyl-gamma-aminobutyrate hydrolase family protein [Azoarcus sp.]